ncbi:MULTISPECIES: hypothetical protein [Cohaesibacter]|uniref:hypothetical protein n=1 Tax=Cohaesibacter TaxID=655352 RepID=UPI000DEB46D0|nr:MULTISPECIES: hypothetical protein [Cohaesibacter]TLP45550.1 hypothetical protein FDK21_12425 [Cohaesibacter sp. CAU 1516]
MAEQDLVGKKLFISLTYVDADGKVIDWLETHGPITEIQSDNVIIEQANGEGLIAIPNDPEGMEIAEDGECQMIESGAIVEVDYISSWTIQLDPSDPLSLLDDSQFATLH